MNGLNLSDRGLLKTKAFIDGAWCVAEDGRSMDVANPATGQVIAQVPDMSGRETRAAIDAAHAAWPE